MRVFLLGAGVFALVSVVVWCRTKTDGVSSQWIRDHAYPKDGY